MLTVWAVDPGLVRRGLLRDAKATVVFRDAEVGNFVVTLPNSDDLAQRLTKGWRVRLQDDEIAASGVINKIAEDDVAGTRTVSGFTDLERLKNKLTYPNPAATIPNQTADGQYRRTGPAETLIRDLVNLNVGPGALSGRAYPGLAVAASQGRGKSLVVATQWEELLEQCRKLARLGGVTFDLVQEEDWRLVFRTRVPRDLSRRVRFNTVNGGLQGGDYEISAPTATTVIAAGKGTGTYKNMREYTRASAWGERIEQFLDQKNTDDDPEILQAATEALDEGAETATASIAVNEVEGHRFGVDFLLGDTFAVEMGSATIAEPVRSVEVEWDEFGRTAKLSLGDYDQEVNQRNPLRKLVKKLDARQRRNEVR